MDLLHSANTYIVLLYLVLFGLGYGWRVRRLREMRRNHGYTAWLVVVGNGVIIFAFGLLAGLEAAALLLLCNVAAGAPMIWEYMDYHLNAENEEEQRQAAARLLKDLE